MSQDRNSEIHYDDKLTLTVASVGNLSVCSAFRRSSLSDSVCGSALCCARGRRTAASPHSPVLCACSARAGLFTSSNAPILPVLATRRGVQARPSCNKPSEESSKTQVSSDTLLSPFSHPSRFKRCEDSGVYHQPQRGQDNNKTAIPSLTMLASPIQYSHRSISVISQN